MTTHNPWVPSARLREGNTCDVSAPLYGQTELLPPGWRYRVIALWIFAAQRFAHFAVKYLSLTVMSFLAFLYLSCSCHRHKENFQKGSNQNYESNFQKAHIFYSENSWSKIYTKNTLSFSIQFWELDYPEEVILEIQKNWKRFTGAVSTTNNNTNCIEFDILGGNTSLYVDTDDWL